MIKVTYYFMHKNLFDRVNIMEENTNVPNGMEADSAKECARYGRTDPVSGRD